MKRRIGLAAALVLAVALSLGSTTSSSATGDNAVVHWSGIAEAAISAGATPTTLRPPASSTVLAAMVHGAMYDAVVAIEGDFVPFATGVSAPAGASVDAAVAQAARDVLVVRVPAQAASVQTRVRRVHGGRPGRDAPRSAARPSAPPPRRACSRCAWATGSTTSSRTSSRRPGPACSSRSPPGDQPVPPPTPVDVKLGKVRPFTYTTPAYRPDRAVRAHQQGLRGGRRRAPAARRGDQHRPARPRRPRPCGSSPTRPTCSTAAGCAPSPTNAASTSRESARLLGYTWVAVADTMIACWEAKYHYMFWRPNHAIQRADTDGNAATTPIPTWLPLVTGNHPEYPSGHALLHRRPDEVAPGVLRHEAARADDDEHGHRHDAGRTTASASSWRTSRTPASGAASTTARR